MSEFDWAEFLRGAIIVLPPLLFAITVHETAHGWMAKRLGDPTAYQLGRLTLNPLKHIDPVGTLIVPLLLYLLTPFVFGWAKPVPVIFGNLRSPRRDMILVAAAGPGSNLLMAAIWSLVPVVLFPIQGIGEGAQEVIVRMSTFGILINVLLAVFNLLPIPPLDGGRVLAGLLPPRLATFLDKIEPFGILIVLLLMIFGQLFRVIEPVVYDVIRFFGGLQRFLLQFWGL